MNMNDIENAASALYDGGWRVGDREQLKRVHGLTDKQADVLCRELAEYGITDDKEEE
jgi:hypothetical protein